MEGIVFLLAAQDLDGALQLRLPADQRVVGSHLVIEANHLGAPGFLMTGFS